MCMMYEHERNKSECIQKDKKKFIDILINKISTINHHFQNRAFYYIDNFFLCEIRVNTYGRTCF